MNKKIIAVASAAALIALPLVTLAFNPGSTPNAAPSLSVNDLIDILFSLVWPIVIAFAIISFIVAAFLFLTAQGDPAKIAQGRQAVLWGIVGVVIAFLAFSIPFIVRNTLGNGI